MLIGHSKLYTWISIGISAQAPIKSSIKPCVLCILALLATMSDKDRSRSPISGSMAVRGKGSDNGAVLSKGEGKGQDNGEGVAVTSEGITYPHHYEIHVPDLDQVFTSFTGKGKGYWRVWSSVAVVGDKWIACNCCGIQWPDWTRRGSNCDQCAECEGLPILPLLDQVNVP